MMDQPAERPVPRARWAMAASVVAILVIVLIGVRIWFFWTADRKEHESLRQTAAQMDMSFEGSSEDLVGKHGIESPLLQLRSDRVKANPQDTVGVIEFLDFLFDKGRVPLRENELSWMVDLCNPDRATEAGDIASGLKAIHSYREAVAFYRRALGIPLTIEEAQRVGRQCADKFSSEQLRVMFAVHVREQLAECLVKLKCNDEAQAALVEAAHLRKRHHLGASALFPGRGQSTNERIR